MHNQVAHQQNYKPSIAQGYSINSMPTLAEMHQIFEISKVLASAPFYQKLGPGGVMAIYLTAREMNLPLMFSLNGGMHNLDGKVVLSAQLMNMMLINAGWEVHFLQMDKLGCELKFIYPGKKRSETFKFTIEDAQAAGYLGIAGPNGTYLKKPKDNWLYHPLDMCFSRAIASGARKYAPNVIGCCYGIGELDNDDHLKPILPENIPQAEIDENEQKQIEIQKQMLVDFVKRNEIIENSEIYDYVNHIAKSKSINYEKSLELCLKNEESFLNSFKKLQEKQKKLSLEEKVIKEQDAETQTECKADLHTEETQGIQENQ